MGRCYDVHPIDEVHAAGDSDNGSDRPSMDIVSRDAHAGKHIVFERMTGCSNYGIMPGFQPRPLAGGLEGIFETRSPGEGVHRRNVIHVIDI